MGTRCMHHVVLVGVQRGVGGHRRAPVARRAWKARAARAAGSEGTCRARSGLRRAHARAAGSTVWVRVCREAVSTPTSLALLLLLRRAGRNWRSRPEQRVRGGGAEVPVARERMQMQMWSAACRHMLHGSRQGLWVSVMHASG